MRTYLIVNADDFGLNKAVNEGIMEAVNHGIVTSVSLMVNTGGFSDAMEIMRKDRMIDVGLHLNVFRGKPISQLNYLVDKNGNFAENILLFFIKCYLNKQRAAREIYEEFDCQIKRALDNGVNISHLDTEKHIHILPFILKIMIELAKKYNIAAVRFPFEKNWLTRRPAIRQFGKLCFMSFLHTMNKKVLNNKEIKSPDFFYGVSLSGKYSIDSVKRFIDSLKPGINELSCHPGLGEDWRNEELEALVSREIKKYITDRNIDLVNFKVFQK